MSTPDARPVPGQLTFSAPRRGKPPRHLADLTLAERREAVVGAVSLPLLLGGAWWAGAALGAVAAGAATLGDLIESSIKRDLGIKDMGHLLPGHGGLMDRLDSLLPSAAVAYLLLSLLAPV